MRAEGRPAMTDEQVRRQRQAPHSALLLLSYRDGPPTEPVAPARPAPLTRPPHRLTHPPHPHTHADHPPTPPLTPAAAPQVKLFVDRFMPAYRAYLPGLYGDGPTTAAPARLLVVEVDERREPAEVQPPPIM